MSIQVTNQPQSRPTNSEGPGESTQLEEQLNDWILDEGSPAARQRLVEELAGAEEQSG